ncbi:hypothetical protein BRC82_04835 [Halobacteriales archaeon QS_1_67_19]|nr:MAG: hypothetical protein BRC82_04835 [Halobacteriales archaeon QS_1_67_19]
MRRLIRVGSTVAVLGVVPFAFSAVGNPVTSCTVAEATDESGGFRLVDIGFDGITYTLDGVNTCVMDLAVPVRYLGVVATVAGTASVGIGLLARWATREP